MTRLLPIVLFVAACGGDETADPEYPIMPTGGTGGSTGPIQPVVDASPFISGRVCKLLDARMPTACATTGAEGITVELGGQTAMTSADGSFSIMRPAAGDMWKASGTAIKASAMKYAPAENALLPAVDLALYTQMLTNTAGASEDAANGGLIAQLRRNGALVQGAVIVENPSGASPLYYEGSASDVWIDQTTSGALSGPNGVIWVPSMMPVTMGELFVDDMLEVEGITVIAGHVTFVFANI